MRQKQVAVVLLGNEGIKGKAKEDMEIAENLNEVLTSAFST